MSDFAKCADCGKELKVTLQERNESTSTPLCINCFKKRSRVTDLQEQITGHSFKPGEEYIAVRRLTE